MPSLTFDRHIYIKKFTAKGMSEELAEDITDAMAASIVAASKDTDVSHLANKDELKAALSEVKADIIKWVVGMSFAQTAMFLTILKLH